MTVTRCIASDAPPDIGFTESTDRAPATVVTHASRLGRLCSALQRSRRIPDPATALPRHHRHSLAAEPHVTAPIRDHRYTRHDYRNNPSPLSTTDASRQSACTLYSLRISDVARIGIYAVSN